MPRSPRVAPGGLVYHVINRAAGKQKLFRRPADYETFLGLLSRAKEAVPGVRVLGYCLLPDHWHLALWPKKDGELSSFMLRVMTAHVRRHFVVHPSKNDTQLYQGRFKNFAVQPDDHILTLLRYVESAAEREGVAKAAGAWKWSSIAGGDLVDDSPVKRPRNWQTLLGRSFSDAELESIHTSISRGRPFGDPEWVAKTVKKLGLGHTVRPRGRPRKSAK